MEGLYGVFGEKLRRYRVEAGLTQAGLGELSGISAQAISTLERGVRKYPRRHTVEAIARALRLNDTETAVLLGAATRRRQPHVDSAPDIAAKTVSHGHAVPRCLPPAVADFTGRGEELRQLKGLLGDASTADAVVVSAIEGMGGIGKTALAVKAAHSLADVYPDGQLYINLRGFGPGDPATPDEALDALMSSMGVERLPQATTEESAARYRSHLAGKRMLVLLDNANDAEQVRPLLPGVGGCAAIVTSRRSLASLPGARHLLLDVLVSVEAVALFETVVGADRVRAEHQVAYDVVGYCGYLPLAIRITGARLAARPGWPIARLRDQLADEHRRLDGLEQSDVGVRASFAASLRDLAMSEDPRDRAAATAFPLLGLLDCPDLGLEVAACLLDLTVRDAEEVLERLVDAHLVETVDPGRYKLHDLLRSYAREQAAAEFDTAERAAAVTRVVALFNASAWRFLRAAVPTHVRLNYADESWLARVPDVMHSADMLSWLGRERVNLVAAFQHASEMEDAPHELLSQLAIAALGFVSRQGYWPQMVEIVRTSLRLAEKSGDHVAMAFARHDLGASLLQFGRLEEGTEELEVAVAHFHAAGDQLGEAMALANLAYALDRLGRVHEGIAACERGLRLCSGGAHKHLEAITCLALGMLHVGTGDRVAEVTYCERSLAIYAELDYDQGRARALYNLGVAHRRTGRAEDARRAFVEAIELCDALRIIDTGVCARLNLAALHSDIGQPEEALRLCEVALGVALSGPVELSEAEARRGMGEALAALSLRDEARRELERSLAIYERLGSRVADEIRQYLDTELDRVDPHAR